MAQFALPDADEAVGSWTATPLWSKVDEGVASIDGTVILSDSIGNNSSTTFADLRLSDVTDPSVSTGHVIRAHWRHNVAGRSLEGHAELWQGVPGVGTEIAALVVTPDIGSTLNTDSYTLTAGEADSITDYTDLYIRLWGFGSGGGPSRALEVDAVEFEVPDAGPLTVQVSGSDGAEASDSGSIAAAYALSEQDGAEAGDSASAGKLMAVSGDDGAEASDSGGSTLTFSAQGSEGADAGDTATGSLSVSVDGTDGAEAGDSASETIDTGASPPGYSTLRIISRTPGWQGQGN